MPQLQPFPVKPWKPFVYEWQSFTSVHFSGNIWLLNTLVRVSQPCEHLIDSRGMNLWTVPDDLPWGPRFTVGVNNAQKNDMLSFFQWEISLLQLENHHIILKFTPKISFKTSPNERISSFLHPFGSSHQILLTHWRSLFQFGPTSHWWANNQVQTLAKYWLEWHVILGLIGPIIVRTCSTSLLSPLRQLAANHL